MKFIEVKDYVIAIDSIAHLSVNSATIAIKMKNEQFPILVSYKTATEAKEIYKNIKEILLKPLDK